MIDLEARASPGAAQLTNDPYGSSRRTIALIGVIGLAGAVVVLAAYVALETPGRWLASAAARTFAADQLTVARGTGMIEGDHLILSKPGSDGTALVSLTADLRSDEYLGVEWKVTGLAEGARASLLWRTDVAPRKVSSIPLGIESGRVLPIVMANRTEWIGRVVGLALLIQGPMPKPVDIHGVVAKPMSAADIMRERWREWLAFEPWTGTSIRSVTGGADVQSFPLPVVGAASIAAAAALWLIVTSIARAPRTRLPVALAVFFIGWWGVLDMRWAWNLTRQVSETAHRYGGLDAREKLLASEDGELYAWLDQARSVLPKTPARIFVVAAAPYFRGRLAYHLYPHNVFYYPLYDAMPPRDWLRHGDWLLVYHHHGVEYDATRRSLRWAGATPVTADVKAVGSDSALFEIE